jgi:hypothetical protein
MDMQTVTVKNCRNSRYGEIFIIKETGLDVYNTTGMNDCPAALSGQARPRPQPGRHDLRRG